MARLIDCPSCGALRHATALACPHCEASGSPGWAVRGALLAVAVSEVVAALKAAGIRAGITTGGLGVTAGLARQMAAAGLFGASVSVDGLGDTHDAIRATVGGFARATAAACCSSGRARVCDSVVSLGRPGATAEVACAG